VSKPKSQKDISPSKVFSVKPEADDIGAVPSITKLLNRKKIVTGTRTNAKFAPPPGSLPSQAPSQLPNQVPSQVKDRQATKLTPITKKTSVQKASPRSRARASLDEWDPTQLRAQDGKDAFKQVLQVFFERKIAQSALYLQNSQPNSGAATAPLFSASAAIAANSRKSLWKGLQWDPQVFPDVWKVLQKNGYAEFQPGVRNANCAAFGVDSSSWLTLIRVGASQDCDGLVAIISSASLTLPLSKVIHHFTNETDFSSKKKSA
jgi:hypothetical protein